MSDSLREDKQLKGSHKKGSLIIGVGLAVAVLLLVAVVFFLLKTAKVVEPAALVVGEREVSKERFDEYVELGKKTSTSAATVKAIVIEYEKNRVAAQKHKIDLPEAYIALSREDMIAEAAQQPGDVNALRMASDDLTKLRLYNIAFENYLNQSAEGGWSLVLYDVPVIQSLDPDASVQRAQNSAKSLRDKIANKQLTVPAGVEAARQLNIGQPAQSGMYFIRESDGAVIGRYGGGVYARLLDPDFIRNQVKEKQPGLSEVQNYNNQSLYFIDLLYTQKKQADLSATINNEKTGMKVVDYVNQ